MTTEDLIEKVLSVALWAYKKNSRGSREALKLDRHEYIEVDGKRIDSAYIPVGELKDGSKIVAYMGKNAVAVSPERV